MSAPDPIPIYTIGYGARELDELIALLRGYAIEYVVDVRSAPYSRFKPEFSKASLEAALQRAGIRYLFLGQSLGGRPDDADCYVDGKVDYEAIKVKQFYHQGIERLERAFRQQQRIVLFCSEGKPEQCHRSKLIGASLDALDIPVLHIDENGALKSQADVIQSLTGGQLSLFGEPSFTSRRRYQTEDREEEE